MKVKQTARTAEHIKCSVREDCFHKTMLVFYALNISYTNRYPRSKDELGIYIMYLYNLHYLV